MPAVIPHFQPKTKKQYFLMMAVLVGATVLCGGVAVWLKLRSSFTPPVVIQKAAGLYEEKKYDEAAALLADAVAEIEKRRGPEDASLLKYFDLLAQIYEAQKKDADAEKLWRRAYEIRRKNLGPEHGEVYGSADRLALSLKAQGKYEEAEALLKKSLAHREAYHGLESPSVMPSLNRLAELYIAQKKFAEAEPLARRAVTIGRSTTGLIPASYADSMHDLGAVLASQGKYDEAEPLYDQALKRKYALLPAPHHPNKPGQPSPGDVAELAREFAAMLRKAGKEKDAKELEEKAEGLLHPKE